MPPSTLSVGMPLNKQPMHGNGALVFASRKAVTNHVYGWLHLGQSALYKCDSIRISTCHMSFIYIYYICIFSNRIYIYLGREINSLSIYI